MKDTKIIKSESGEYTMFSTKPGGPVITGKTIEEVENKFKEAMNLSIAVKTVLEFQKKMLSVDHNLN